MKIRAGYHAWTKADDARLTELWANKDINLKDIASEFGCSVGAVKQRACRILKLAPVRRPMLGKKAMVAQPKIHKPVSALEPRGGNFDSSRLLRFLADRRAA